MSNPLLSTKKKMRAAVQQGEQKVLDNRQDHPSPVVCQTIINFRNEGFQLYAQKIS